MMEDGRKIPSRIKKLNLIRIEWKHKKLLRFLNSFGMTYVVYRGV